MIPWFIFVLLPGGFSLLLFLFTVDSLLRFFLPYKIRLIRAPASQFNLTTTKIQYYTRQWLTQNLIYSNSLPNSNNNFNSTRNFDVKIVFIIWKLLSKYSIFLITSVVNKKSLKKYLVRWFLSFLYLIFLLFSLIWDKDNIVNACTMHCSWYYVLSWNFLCKKLKIFYINICYFTRFYLKYYKDAESNSKELQLSLINFIKQ